MNKLVLFDLEGPISLDDHAFEAASLFRIPYDKQDHSGKLLYDALSSYVASRAQDGGMYQPGDTLSLFVPFLLRHGITDEDLQEVAKRMRMFNDAGATIQWIKENGGIPFIVSTSYEHNARPFAQRVGVDSDKVFCTRVSLDGLKITERDRNLLDQAEAKVVQLGLDGSRELGNYFDDFFNHTLAESDYGLPLDRVKAMGGRNKAEGALRIANEYKVPSSSLVAIGDSITDREMLRTVREAGGLAVAFNANRHALSEANIALATTHLWDLTNLVANFWEGGIEHARNYAILKEMEKATGRGRKELGPLGPGLYTENFSVLKGEYALRVQPFDHIVETHKRMRQVLRGNDAALLP